MVLRTGPVSVSRGPVLIGNHPLLSASPPLPCGDFKLGWIKVIQKPSTTHPGTSEVELKTLEMVQVILRKLEAKRSGAA